jgi:hypothetical protein
VDLSGIEDPQRPLAFVVGSVLIVVGVAGVTGIIDADVLGQGLVLGVFGVPFWLGVTAVVAGLLGIVLSFYAGAGTTFNKLAAGLVLPAILLLAIADWLFAGGITLPTLGLGLIAIALAVVLVAVGVILLYKHPLALVLPTVALLAVIDWAFGVTAMIPGEAVNLPTIGLLLVLAVVIGLIAFEGGSRMT